MSLMKDKDILIIDDSSDVRYLIRRVLESDGAQISEAPTCDYALSSINKIVPHLIVLDLVMPGRSGYDFLLARKSNSRIANVPVVVLTGKKDRDSVLQAAAFGITSYILKPFTALVLLKKVRGALKLTSALKRKLGEEDNDCKRATFSVKSSILEINEGGCRIEAPVKIAGQVHLDGEMVGNLGLTELFMKSGPRAKYITEGRYTNEIFFAGMGEQHAKKIRGYLKELR